MIRKGTREDKEKAKERKCENTGTASVCCPCEADSHPRHRQKRQRRSETQHPTKGKISTKRAENLPRAACCSLFRLPGPSPGRSCAARTRLSTAQPSANSHPRQRPRGRPTLTPAQGQQQQRGFHSLPYLSASYPPVQTRCSPYSPRPCCARD